MFYGTVVNYNGLIWRVIGRGRKRGHIIVTLATSRNLPIVPQYYEIPITTITKMEND